MFTTASAYRSLPEKEAKKGFSFEIESIDDDEGGNGDAEGNEEEMAEEEEEDGEEEDYEMASRCLKSPHLSSFFTSDATEEIGSSSSSSSSALVYSPVKVLVPLMKKAAKQPELN